MAFHFDHVNITVVSIERARGFLGIAFPHFGVRGGGQGEHDGMQTAWEHFGTDEEYISLNQTSEVELCARDGSRQTGLNHLGFVVYDLSKLHERYEAAGFKCTYLEEPPARLRMYVMDQDGIQWEFIQYLSDDPAVQNDNTI
jgi:catechol 2,3-dioxygenase-like lactoylglutathione lyase family enzyme